MDLLVVIALGAAALLAKDLRMARFGCDPDNLVAALRSHLVDGTGLACLQDVAVSVELPAVSECSLWRFGLEVHHLDRGRPEHTLEIFFVDPVVPTGGSLCGKKS